MSGTTSDDDGEEYKSIVIDNGSCMLKAGIGGGEDDVPRVIYPTVVGRNRTPTCIVNTNTKDVYVGKEAQIKRGILSLSYPIERGIIKDWDNMEKIWHHTFYNELRVDPAEHRMLLTDSTMIANDREKMTQIMFETFNVPALYISLQAVLSLYASGHTNGIVLDSGYGVTNTVPVFEGDAVPSCVERVEYGGYEMTQYLTELLVEHEYMSHTVAEPQIVNDIKEKLGYVAFDFEKEMQNASTRNYEFPDGHTIDIGNELFRATESLFQPNLVGMEASGIHECIQKCFVKCWQDFHPKKLSEFAIVLAGGNTMFSGIHERLKKEIFQLISPAMSEKVITPPDREYSAWKGGSICVNMSFLEDEWINKEVYQESGPGIVRQKWCKSLLW